MRPNHPIVPHLLERWQSFGLVASRFSCAALILALSSACCSHVDHKKLATFPTIRKSFEGIKSNVHALKVTDENSKELQALTVEECEEGINLCRESEAEK